MWGASPPLGMGRVKISNWYCIFELRFEIRSLKITHYIKFFANPSKSKETIKNFDFFSCHNIKITIIRSYFQIRDDVIIKNSQDFYRSYIPTKFQHHLSHLNGEKFWKTCLFDHVLAKHSPLIGYHGNNEWPIPKLLISNDDLYNCLKIIKFGEDLLSCFGDI